MARHYTYQSFCQNLLFIGKNELAKTAPEAFTNSNGTFSHISAMSYFSNLVLTLLCAYAIAAANLTAKYAKENL